MRLRVSANAGEAGTCGSAWSSHHEMIAEYKRGNCLIPVGFMRTFKRFLEHAGEPIVHTPANAVADLLSSDLDALAIGDFVITKRAAR